MSDQTSISVTEVPCSCDYLVASAENPNLPVNYDVELKEFYFEHTLPTGVIIRMVLNHCPMCGGVASSSVRDTLFAAVPEREGERLNSLTRGINGIADIERLLGAWDSDAVVPAPLDVLLPLRPGEPAGPIRVLTYRNLSDVADVQFTVYPSGKIQTVIAPKFVRKRTGD
jgi:hypothetical protein